MKPRTREALRNLAERPGTAAEGDLARSMLARAEEKKYADVPADEAPAWKAWDLYNAGHLSLEEFIQSLRGAAIAGGEKLPKSWTCACGCVLPIHVKCQDVVRHGELNQQLRTMFPVGSRVYYNKWAYDVDYPGVVMSYPPEWNWIRIKFDKLKTTRSVPIYSHIGWHLSHSPLMEAQAAKFRAP